MEKDGICGVVIRVDDSGEHGLIMSLTGSIIERNIYDEVAATFVIPDNPKEKNKVLKKIDAASRKKIREYLSDYSEKMTVHYNNLATELTSDGKHNSEVIKQYCLDNNLDMKEFFPAQYWASTLGDGWYITGDNELEDYSYVVGNGLGKKLYKGGIAVSAKFYEKANELSKKTIEYRDLESISIPYKIWSSSMGVDQKKNVRNCFRDSCHQTQLTEHYWWEIVASSESDNNWLIWGITPCDCAVCEF